MSKLHYDSEKTKDTQEKLKKQLTNIVSSENSFIKEVNYEYPQDENEDYQIVTIRMIVVDGK